MMKFNFSGLWKVVSILVPIPEGYAVGLAIYDVLHWDVIVVWIASAIVALTGFLAIDVTNRMSEYNSSLMDDEKKFSAQTWRGIVVMVIWFAGVVLLTVFLKVVPMLATWTPLGLVVVGSSAAWLRSINKGQEAREQELSKFRASKAEDTRKQREANDLRKEETRKERREARKAKRARDEQVASTRQAIQAGLQGKKDAHFVGSSVPQKPRSQRRSVVSDEGLVVEYKLDPTITSTALAVRFGVSRQAVDQRRDALAKAGILNVVRDNNGHVVRVDVLLADASTMGQGR